MGIKHLDAYLTERQHHTTLPLSALADTRLGIDAGVYLGGLLATHPEPLLAATGGLPLALTTRIEADLRVLERARVKPVFVFSGLGVNTRAGPPAKQGQAGGQGFGQGYGHGHGGWVEACADRQVAWERYEAGREDEATRLFAKGLGFSAGSITGERQWDLWRMVLRIFRHRNVEFMVAPYLGWAQLIYLQRHPKAYVHAIFGPTEVLLYPSHLKGPAANQASLRNSPFDKLITSLDLSAATPTFTYVSKAAILGDLGVGEDMFLDIGVLVGFSEGGVVAPGPGGGALTFPPTAHEQALKATVDMVKYYKNGWAAVLAFQDHPPTKAVGYPECFGRMRSVVRFGVVFGSEGSVAPLPLALSTLSGTHPSSSASASSHVVTAADIPSDLDLIFTGRLPDEVFFYLSRGLMTPLALSYLTSGVIGETPPMDNGETTEYKRFVKEVVSDGTTGPRATGLALVSGVCGREWTRRSVGGWFWFDVQGQGGPNANANLKPIMHNGPQTAALAERVAGWQVRYATVEEELRRQNSSTIDFALCLGATATERLAARTKHKADGPGKVMLDRKDEIVANAIWRFLELRGFLLGTHMHSALARAMHTSLSQARVNDKFQDPLYIFLELVRAGVMHGHLWSGRAFSGGPSFGGEEEKTSMLLVMRVLSVVPLSVKPAPWSAPLSRELLVFNSFVRALTRSLRMLLESVTVNMLVRGDARRARDDFLDITLSLPFQGEVNTGFGVLAKVYLDALTHINGGRRLTPDSLTEETKEMKKVALEICEETFGGVRNPKAEVERGFRFWDVALMAMRQLHGEGAVLRELIDQFEAAEAWLAPMRP